MVGVSTSCQGSENGRIEDQKEEMIGTMRLVNSANEKNLGGREELKVIF